MSRSTRVTLQDIADQLAVSKATVSMALRSDPSIPAATRRRVQRIAKRLGYTPDPRLSQLMQHLRTESPNRRATTVALLNARPPSNKLAGHSFLAAYERGIHARAQQLGFFVEEFHLAGEVTGERLQRIWHSRGVDGVLVAPLPDEIDTLTMNFESFSCSSIGFSLKSPEIHRAVPDQFLAGRLAFEELTALGYERIGLVSSAMMEERTQQRMSGAFLIAQLAVPKNQRVPILFTEPLEHSGFDAWFKRYQPDCILSYYEATHHFLRRKRKMRVPRDIGFAVLDVEPGGKHSGIDQKHEAVGEAAIDLLSAQFYRHETGIPPRPRTLLIPPTWINGNTTRRSVGSRSSKPSIKD